MKYTNSDISIIIVSEFQFQRSSNRSSFKYYNLGQYNSQFLKETKFTMDIAFHFAFSYMCWLISNITKMCPTTMMHSKNVFDAKIGQDATTRKCIKTYAFVFTRPKLHFSKKVAIQITTTLSRMGHDLRKTQK